MNKKILLGFFVILLVSSVCGEDRESGGVLYYEFTESGDIIEDQWGGYNASNSNSSHISVFPTYNICGDGSPHSRNFTGEVPAGNSSNITTANLPINDEEAWSFWLNPWALSPFGAGADMIIEHSGTDRRQFYYRPDSHAYRLNWENEAGTSTYVNLPRNATIDSWTHIIIQYNSSPNCLCLQSYFNNTLQTNTSMSEIGTTGMTSISIGNAQGEAEYGMFLIDGLKVYNRSLGGSERSNLYKHNTLIGRPGDMCLPTINHPENSTTYNLVLNVSEINISINKNGLIWLNDSRWITNISNTTYNSFYNPTYTSLTSGRIDINVTANDTVGNQVGYILTFWIDTIDPTITTDFINNTIYYLNNITGQFNFSDNQLIYSYNITVDGLQIAAASSLDTSFVQYNLSILPSFTEGEHTLGVRIADVHTDNLISPESYNPNNGNEMKYEIRSPYKKTDIITELKDKSFFDKWTAIEEKNKFSEILEPWTPKETQIIIVRSDRKIDIVELPKVYGGKWLIIGEHWRDFVIKNEPKAYIENIKRISDYEVEVTIKGITNNPERIEFDSVGELNIIQENYTFHITNATESFKSIIIEDYPTTLYLNITGLNGTTPNTILEFNGTNYTATLISSNSTFASYSRTITPDLNISLNTSILHRWYFNLTDNNYENTSFQTQVLYNLSIGACEGNRSYLILNITYLDEDDKSNIEVTNTYNFSIFDGTNYFNQAGVSINKSNITFCTTLPPDTTYNWNAWGQIAALIKEDYATRVVSIDQLFPLILSNNPPLDLPLYLPKLNDSVTVSYNWLTNLYQAVDGTMRIYRCLDDGTIPLVESIPIISGSTSANIDLTAPYLYEVIYQNQLFREEDGFSQCHLESSTDITLFIDVGDINVTPLIGLVGIPCTLSRVGNFTVNMTWTPNQELPGYIQGCIRAYRHSAGGNTEVYNNCTVEADGYSRLVGIPISGYTYTVLGELRQGNNTIQCGESLSFLTAENNAALMGVSALFGALLLIMSMALFYAGEGERSLVAASIGIIVSWFIGILNFPFIIVTAMILFLLIIAGIGRFHR